jgi:tetratricopeptide (TPR) repeat protein
MRTPASIFARIGQFRSIAPFLNAPTLVMVATILAVMLWSCPALSKTGDGVPNVSSGAEPAASPEFHDVILRGIEFLEHDNYESALETFENLKERHPRHPAPHFFKAVAYQQWMTTFRLKRYQKEMEENIQLAIQKGKALLYIDAKRGMASLRKALEREPALYDAYLGLGSYHYWRTAKSNFIRIIAFWVPDQRELGLRQLEFCAAQGLYARYEAIYNLIVAYFDYGKYEKAFEVFIRTIGRKKIHSISDLYIKARLLVEFGKWPEVESLFREILERLDLRGVSSIGYRVECKYWVAQSLLGQDRLGEALAMAAQALAQSETRNPDRELDGYFDDFDQIKADLSELYAYLKQNTNLYPLRSGRKAGKTRFAENPTLIE